MGLLRIESWNGLDTSAVGDKYTGYNYTIVTSPSGPFQSKCLEYYDGHLGRVNVQSASIQDVIFGIWVRWESTVTAFGSYGQMAFANSSQGAPYYQIRMGRNSSGIFQVQNKTSITGYQTLVNTGPTLNYNTWYYLEFRFKKHQSTGYFELRINGQRIGTFSGDTHYDGGTDVDRIFLYSSAWQDYMQYGPFYIIDPNTAGLQDFLGPIRVDAHFPVAAGANTDFDISGESEAATNWESVDDSDPDDDTTYVRSATATERDTYPITNVDLTGTPIYGVQGNLRARKDEASVRTMKQTFRSIGGEEFDTSGELALSQSYDYYESVWESNPSGEITWTEEEVNSGEFGFKLQA